jgi:hypothetical protein
MRDLMIRLGIVGDILRFLWARKLYWLVPMIVALILVAVLIIGGSSGAAPFIYSVF